MIPVRPSGEVGPSETNSAQRAEATEVRLCDYEQTVQVYRQLAEIRFKLLAFVPTLSGAAVALLTSASGVRPIVRSALALLGFVATLAILIYDQRNTAFYNAAIGRAKHLERRLGLDVFENDKNPGLFGSRGTVRARRIFGIRVQHDLGLALIYASALGTWAFAFALETDRIGSAAAGAAGTIVAVAMFVQLQRLDGRFASSPWTRRREDPDKARLTEINAQIPVAENQGDRLFFDDLLADSFAMRRAGGLLVDRATFIAGLTTGGDRSTDRSQIEVDLSGNTAVVSSVARMTVQGAQRSFNNLRVFIRAEQGGEWRLVAWVNEEI